MSPAPVSLGFLRPGPGRITAAEPEVTYGDAQPVTDGRAPAWDYNAPVRVEWPVTVDLAGVLADCGLAGGTQVNAVISWHSTWTNLRGAGPVVTVTGGSNAVRLEVPGEMLGGTLNLTLAVTLGEPGAGGALFAPRRPGSPLWTQRATVALEGTAARMPVMPVDFPATGRGRQTGVWLLECGRDLTASVTGSLLLYLNTAHPDVQTLLNRPSDPAAMSLARFITYDMTRQLVMRALQHDELDDGGRYEEGTLGALFLMLVQTHLPGRPLDQLRREFEDDPGELEAELMSRAWGTGG